MLAFLGYALLAVVVFFALIAIVEHFSASLANKVLVLVPLCLPALPFLLLGCWVLSAIPAMLAYLLIGLFILVNAAIQLQR